MFNQSAQLDETSVLFLDAEDEKIEALSQENRRLRAKEAFLNRLLLAMTLLTRHRSITSGDLPRAFQDITRMAARSVEVQRASIWFLDGSKTMLSCACLFDGIEDLHGQGAQLLASQYPAYFAEIERGRVIAAEDAVRDPRTREFAEGYLLPLRISSMLDVPIKLGDKLAGVVCLEHTGPSRAWQPEEQQFASFVSSLVSLAAETSERFKEGAATA